MKTIFIAMSERLLCETLCATCVNLGFKVIGSSTDGRDSLKLIEDRDPDIVIIDTELRTVNGFEVLQQLREKHYYVSPILYFKKHDPTLLRKAISLKANRFLFADDDVNELARCLHEAGSVQQFKNKRVANNQSDSESETKEDLLNSLTPAQLKILALVGTHRTMPEIAKELYISPHTVNNHIANIRKKLDLQGRGVLLKYALEIKHRLVEVDGKIMISKNYYNYSAMR